MISMMILNVLFYYLDAINNGLKWWCDTDILSSAIGCRLDYYDSTVDVYFIYINSG